MPRIVTVRPLDGFRLELTFDDGVHGVVSVADRLFGPMFEPLGDPTVFNQAFIDEYGVVCWPNGADLAPDALHQRLRESVASA